MMFFAIIGAIVLVGVIILLFAIAVGTLADIGTAQAKLKDLEVKVERLEKTLKRYEDDLK